MTGKSLLASRPLVCPICGSQFLLHTPKSRAYQLKSRDSDLCPHYQGINPLFYQIRVCPSCFFAAYKPHWGEMPTEEKIAILRLSKENSGMRMDFSRPERSLFAAIQSYQLAYRCYQQRKISSSHLLGHTQLKIAWLCRIGKDLSRESLHLELAKSHLCDAYDYEVGRKAIDESKLAYLIGELNRRTGKGKPAVDWFLRALRSSGGRGELSRMCKDQLYETKEFIRFFHQLQGVDLFQSLEIDHLAMLSAHLQCRRFQPRQTICTSGEPGESLFIVVRGTVKVFADPALPANVLQPGQFFGEASLLTGQSRSATVVAAETAELVEIDKLAFRTLLAYNREVADAISQVIAQRRVDEENDEENEEQEEPKSQTRQGFLARILRYFELNEK